ncbi:MAG: 16S rRNA (cytosine(967)-C(5))-methyltransferase RsmB [Lachnospiraceae bacterium]|nr:16S rRNA (cytosine(967)-C(5))-methyltransferase RsmB [Lachnospiraceae bacterium]
MTERGVVLHILMDGEKNGVSGTAPVREQLDRHAEMTDAQRSFIKRLAEGCIEDRLRLDAVIEKFSGRPASKQRPAVRNALRMGIYQILWMDGVSDYAACSESVELVKKCGLPQMAGFVNGVLRNVARRKQAVLEELSVSESAEVRYSIPAWILEMWTQQYGAERAAGIAAASSGIRPVTIRLAARVKGGQKEELLRGMAAAGAEVTPARWAPAAYELRHTGDIRRLPGFREGFWIVQDESSQLACSLLKITGKETVVDVCAAPGGKALACAERLGGNGKVRAFDLYPQKVERIRENAERMKLSARVDAEVRDASVPRPEDADSADVLICDLPCSGLGVIGRKGDIRFRLQPSDLDALSALQKKILSASAGYLRRGGELLYSTCTIDRLENDGVADYIEKELGMEPVRIGDRLPAGFPGVDGNRVQMTPDLQGTDGFFAALFRRQK